MKNNSYEKMEKSAADMKSDKKMMGSKKTVKSGRSMGSKR